MSANKKAVLGHPTRRARVASEAIWLLHKDGVLYMPDASTTRGSWFTRNETPIPPPYATAAAALRAVCPRAAVTRRRLAQILEDAVLYSLPIEIRFGGPF